MGNYKELILVIENEQNDFGLVEYFASLGVNKIYVVSKKEQLHPACEASKWKGQLLTFCTSIIIPKYILERLYYVGYNFHPGTVNYPGKYPSIWAIYEKAKTFGATMHELAPKVDTGKIISIITFDILPHMDRQALDTESLKACFEILKKTAPIMIDKTKQLSPIDVTWDTNKHKYTYNHYLKLCQLPLDCSIDEFKLRKKACGIETQFYIKFLGKKIPIDI